MNLLQKYKLLTTIVAICLASLLIAWFTFDNSYFNIIRISDSSPNLQFDVQTPESAEAVIVPQYNYIRYNIDNKWHTNKLVSYEFTHNNTSVKFTIQAANTQETYCLTLNKVQFLLQSKGVSNVIIIAFLLLIAIICALVYFLKINHNKTTNTKSNDNILRIFGAVFIIVVNIKCLVDIHEFLIDCVMMDTSNTLTITAFISYTIYLIMAFMSTVGACKIGCDQALNELNKNKTSNKKYTKKQI